MNMNEFFNKLYYYLLNYVYVFLLGLIGGITRIFVNIEKGKKYNGILKIISALVISSFTSILVGTFLLQYWNFEFNLILNKIGFIFAASMLAGYLGADLLDTVSKIILKKVVNFFKKYDVSNRR
jgi:hypothetical protein